MPSDLEQRRLAVVREHMQSENDHRFDLALGTFDHPRYEIVATGDVYDGAEQVSEYYRSSRSAFPINATRTPFSTAPMTR